VFKNSELNLLFLFKISQDNIKLIKMKIKKLALWKAKIIIIKQIKIRESLKILIKIIRIKIYSFIRQILVTLQIYNEKKIFIEKFSKLKLKKRSKETKN
jgi:hypothetical protein